ncbi:hypothetical protein JCM5353_001183 [Sporobolomyces roseus]
MALRRPPTAISLKPSDVSDLREFIQKRDELAKQQQQNEEPTTSTTGGGAKDALLDQEKKDREDREGKAGGKGQEDQNVLVAADQFRDFSSSPHCAILRTPIEQCSTTTTLPILLNTPDIDPVMLQSDLLTQIRLLNRASLGRPLWSFQIMILSETPRTRS